MRSGFRRPHRAFVPRIEFFEPRQLLCNATYSFLNGVLQVECGAGDDYIVLNRSGPSTLTFRLNEHFETLAAADVRMIRIGGLEANDLALLDPAISVPTYLTGVRGDESIAGWLLGGQAPPPGHHVIEGVNHLVITAEAILTGRIAIQPQAGSEEPTPQPRDPATFLGTSTITTHAGHDQAWTGVALNSPSSARSGIDDYMVTESHPEYVAADHAPRGATGPMDERGLGTMPTYRVHKPG
jgi:hypothetical protein